MFTELHAMAKAATLLITASAEGDQLRVSVTPTYPDGKMPAGAPTLRPLSVIGTPEELNADFAQALTIWVAPKRSILEQAEAAAGDADDAAPGKPAAKVVAKEPKAKPGRKTAAATPKADDAGTVGGPEMDGDQASVVEAPAAETPPPAAEPVAQSAPAAVVDTFTIDLF